MIPFLKNVSQILDHPSQKNSSPPTATVALFLRFFPRSSSSRNDVPGRRGDLAWDLKLIGHGKTMGPSVYGGWENHQSNGLEPTFSVHIWGLVTPSGRYSYVSESRFVQDTVFSQFAQFFRQLVKSMVIPSSTWPFSSAAKQWRFKSVR